MIEINLLPQNLRKKRKSTALLMINFNIPKEILYGLIVGTIVLVMALDIFISLLILRKRGELKKYTKKWEQILPQKQRVDVVINELRTLRAQVSAIEKITGQKEISWSSKLNDISDSVPRGVWLQNVSLNEEGILFIKGSGVSKTKDEMINVHSFASALKDKETFLKNLTDLELGSIERRRINTTEVADFLLTAKVKLNHDKK